MTYASTSDEFLATDKILDLKEQPPFQFREDKSEDGTLAWLTTEYDNNEKLAYSRRIVYRRYQSLYKNVHWKYFDARDSRRDNENTRRRPRHSVNFIREMVDARVSQNARMKHHLAFIPAQDEQPDVNNAKLCKIMYDGYAEENGLEAKHVDQDKVTFTLGHSFMFICWDPESGPLSPVYEALKAKNPQKAKKEFKNKDIHVGDVQCDVLGPERVNVERGKVEWMKLNWVERVDYIDTDELKELYPKSRNKIMDTQREIYDFETGELTRPGNMASVRTFYHKPTKFLPEGAMIKYIDDCILEWKDFPYEHGLLPCVPDTDVDVYGEFWSRSFIMDIEQMQRFYNAMQSAQARDFSWMSAPKWLMPKGSANVHSLNNDITVVEYSGPQAPTIAVPSYTPPQTMDLQDRIEKKITQHSRVYQISRGEVPTGVTANSALRFLDEQESQTILVQETKRKRRVVSSAKMILDLMKQYYQAGDGRTVRMIGAKNEYMIKSMKNADFSRVYDVKIQNTSALPDTKTGKIAAIIDLNTATQTDPIFTKEEVIQMLDLGNDDYFKDRATIAVDSANTAFEAVLNGEPITPPQPYDDLLVHYSIFNKGMQHFTYKEKVGGEQKAVMSMHMKALELLMFERARVNMKFCAALLELDNYPMFFKPPMPITKMMALHQQDSMGGAPMTPPQEGIETGKIEKLPQMAAGNQAQGE